MKHYAFNNLSSNLVLKGGYINLPPKRWTPVQALDVQLGVFANEINAGIVELCESENEPESPVVETPAVEIVTVAPTNEGLTEEQLKAHLAETADKPKSLGTTSSLGQTGITPEQLEGSLTPPPAKVETPVAEVEPVKAEEVKPEVAPAKKTAKPKKTEDKTETPAE